MTRAQQQEEAAIAEAARRILQVAAAGQAHVLTALQARVINAFVATEVTKRQRAEDVAKAATDRCVALSAERDKLIEQVVSEERHRVEAQKQAEAARALSRVFEVEAKRRQAATNRRKKRLAAERRRG